MNIKKLNRIESIDVHGEPTSLGFIGQPAEYIFANKGKDLYIHNAEIFDEQFDLFYIPAHSVMDIWEIIDEASEIEWSDANCENLAIEGSDDDGKHSGAKFGGLDGLVKKSIGYYIYIKVHGVFVPVIASGADGEKVYHQIGGDIKYYSEDEEKYYFIPYHAVEWIAVTREIAEEPYEDDICQPIGGGGGGCSVQIYEMSVSEKFNYDELDDVYRATIFCITEPNSQISVTTSPHVENVEIEEEYYGSDYVVAAFMYSSSMPANTEVTWTVTNGNCSTSGIVTILGEEA